ncbi:hypothetical protein ES703_27534 [subsurface metagenome]
MRAALSEKTIFNISIVVLLLSLSVNALSIYNLSKNVLPTLYTFIFGYSLFFALGILYFLLKKNGGEVRPNNFSIFHSYRSNRILQISFYIVAILILIVLNKSLYIKPFLYYLLISIATVIIGFQIISKQESDKKQIYAILFLQIIPLAIIIRGSSFLINPYLIGPDVPWHFHFIQKIIENGYLDPSAYYYYYYPSYHLTQSMSGVILGFSESSFNLINLSISVVSIIIAYLIGKELFNNGKVGLMCSLLLTIATTHIFLVNYNTSKIGGATLLSLCLLLLIKICKSRNLKTNALFWTSIVPLFFWHPEISFALLILLGANFLVYIFMRKKLELNLAFTTLYLIAYIAYPMYVSTRLFTVIVQSTTAIVQSTTAIVQSTSIEKAEYTLVQSFAGQTITMGFLFQSFMAYLGITLLTFFVSYIGLKWLNKLNEVNLFILSYLIVLHILPFITISSGHLKVISERTFVYISLLLIYIAAGSIFEIFKFKSKSSVVIFLMILLVFSFFSVSSYLIGDGNNVFNNKIPVQTTYTTESNLVSYKFLNKTPYHSTIVSNCETIRYTDEGYFVINQPNLERKNWKDSSWGKEVIKNIRNTDLFYNNGDISIYKFNKVGR